MLTGSACVCSVAKLQLFQNGQELTFVSSRSLLPPLNI